MATTAQIKEKQGTDEDPALALAKLLEEHFDEMGWSEEERNRRVALAGARVDAAVARAKAEESA